MLPYCHKCERCLSPQEFGEGQYYDVEKNMINWEVKCFRCLVKFYCVAENCTTKTENIMMCTICSKNVRVCIEHGYQEDNLFVTIIKCLCPSGCVNSCHDRKFYEFKIICAACGNKCETTKKCFKCQKTLHMSTYQVVKQTEYQIPTTAPSCKECYKKETCENSFCNKFPECNILASPPQELLAERRLPKDSYIRSYGAHGIPPVPPAKYSYNHLMPPSWQGGQNCGTESKECTEWAAYAPSKAALDNYIIAANTHKIVITNSLSQSTLSNDLEQKIKQGELLLFKDLARNSNNEITNEDPVPEHESDDKKISRLPCAPIKSDLEAFLILANPAKVNKSKTTILRHLGDYCMDVYPYCIHECKLQFPDGTIQTKRLFKNEIKEILSKMDTFEILQMSQAKFEYDHFSTI